MLFVKYKNIFIVHKIPCVFKDHVKFVLCIKIAQILHLSNFFELKRALVYINLQLRTRRVLDIQLVCLISQI